MSLASIAPLEPRDQAEPIPALGLGFAAGKTPDLTVLRMRITPEFEIGFEVSSAGLAETADGFARVARALSATTIFAS